MSCVIEKHPFEEFIHSDTKYLIIGTFPTHQRNLQYRFYYSGEQNNFWKIIENIYQFKFTHQKDAAAVYEREKFLRQRNIGMTDMHEMCWRNGWKSKDSELYSIKLRDIFSILEKFNSIERLILTSRSKGFGVVGLLETYFIQQGKQLPILRRRADEILEGTLKFNGRDIKIVVPYSPSPFVTNEGRATLDDLTEMYRYCLS